ncbi:VOC family protein [Paucibacter sp. APW11]|uniref:VOC family protein n=1 Tax=Roseateles aquae TaxID=3077235 RepID=A0ABU3P797_9BURK|nr:VOC family protein [Paucibacter sp. APW11]MDT8998461.1 VOC family protein [Paucibacter sp. APW11]
MDAFTTPGAFSWSELMTSDAAAAAEFYGQLFGWSIESMDMPTGQYRVAKIGDVAIAGMMASPDPSGEAPVWRCYVTVADVDAAIERCRSLGGAVLMPAMDVPTVGRMACISDPQGAVINIISYEPKAG